MKKVTEKKLVLDLVRQNGKSYLQYNIPSVVTDCYKVLSKGVRVSKNWYNDENPIEYYDCSELRSDGSYNSLLDNWGCFDDFGANLVDGNGKFNVAIARSVQGKGRILIPEYSDIQDTARGVRSCIGFLRDFLSRRLQKTKLTSTLTIEI